MDEMAAATRCVTLAARNRRLQLVAVYVERLRQLNEPSPFSEPELTGPGAVFHWQREQETVASH